MKLRPINLIAIFSCDSRYLTQFNIIVLRLVRIQHIAY